MVHWSGEMKHIIIGLIAVLSVLHRDVLVSATTGCPRRYLRRINGKCYYFSVKKMNWFGALNNCLRKGLTLAELSNSRDFYGVVEFLSSKGNTEDFWYGANDLQTEGRFQYISNGRLVRYFSNYNLVTRAEHSECDDCMEVRIRNNMTVVAFDNCLEQQYFICSERYCEFAEGVKQRHHSHEHLHHFHHDIGEPSEEAEAAADGFDITSQDNAGSDKVESEELGNAIGKVPYEPYENGASEQETSRENEIESGDFTTLATVPSEDDSGETTPAESYEASTEQEQEKDQEHEQEQEQEKENENEIENGHEQEQENKNEKEPEQEQQQEEEKEHEQGQEQGPEKEHETEGENETDITTSATGASEDDGGETTTLAEGEGEVSTDTTLGEVSAETKAGTSVEETNPPE